ncbi:TNF receptor-associated protein 1, mitochondrial, partial [Bonamia ostreae]
MLRKNFVKFVKSSNRKTNTNFRRFYDFKAFSNPFIKSASFNAFSTTTEPNKIAQKKPEKKAIQINEKIKGKRSEEKFKAETKEILEIVSKSIYTNKEIFLRELISNSSDAIEQLRYKMRESPNDFSQNVDFKINIFTDPQNNRIIIQDNGIGMAKKQLTENLGIIAKSGSKNFMKSIKNKGDKASTIIGQFGVGFYSSFMISSKVEVFTKSWLDKSSSAFYWVSDGFLGLKIFLRYFLGLKFLMIFVFFSIF